MEGIFSICFRTGIIPMKYWKRGLKEMSDKTILEQWRAIAYDQQADRNKLQRFWANYFNIEKGIYEQLLSNPDEVVTGTVKELAEKYGQEVLYRSTEKPLCSHPLSQSGSESSDCH